LKQGPCKLSILLHKPVLDWQCGFKLPAPAGSFVNAGDLLRN
jgi:hypothetical protein